VEYNCSLIKVDWLDACIALRVVGAVLVIFLQRWRKFAQSSNQWEARAGTCRNVPNSTDKLKARKPVFLCTVLIQITVQDLKEIFYLLNFYLKVYTIFLWKLRKVTRNSYGKYTKIREITSNFEK
jgi:hypothetical protein